MPFKVEICTMEILLVAATRQEIARFVTENPMIEYLFTGVGVPATIYQLQKRLHAKKYDLVIQAGIAGTYTEDIDIGAVTLVVQDSFGDLGMEENQEFTSIFDSGFSDPNAFPFSKGWLVNRDHWFHRLNLPLVTGVTVNKVTDSPLQKKQIQQHFDPDIETMEGAACHFVCLQEHIPFLQVRSISNEAGVRDKKLWDFKGSIENLRTALDTILGSAMQLGPADFNKPHHSPDATTF